MCVIMAFEDIFEHSKINFGHVKSDFGHNEIIFKHVYKLQTHYLQTHYLNSVSLGIEWFIHFFLEECFFFP